MIKPTKILFAICGLYLLIGQRPAFSQSLPEYVTLIGNVKSLKGRMWLQTDSNQSYLLNYHDADSLSYINHRAKASGYLLQGYDNPKYGQENLPIEQIDTKDIINIITGVRLTQIN